MSLYTRLTRPDRAAGEIKIPIHGFCALLLEWARGYVTGGEIATLFSLTPDEVTDGTWLKDQVLAVPADKRGEFLRVFRDILYLAELQLMYTTQAEMQTRVASLVTDLNV